MRKMLRIIVVPIAVVLFNAAGFTQVPNPTDRNSAIQNVWERDSPSKLAQSVRIGGGAVSQEKFGFYWETRIAPATPAVANGFSTRVSDALGIIHRILLDQSGRTYFGYDVLVDVLPEANTYRVTFQPLVMTSTLVDKFSMGRNFEWTPLAAPRFPPPQTVHGGAILELTLLTNSTTNQRIVDYISIQEPTRQMSPFQQRDFSFTTGSPRDITAGDVEMRIQSPRLSINGILEQDSTMHFEIASGKLIWIYVPNHGRFILSLTPQATAGFNKAGEIRGSSLSFKDGADTFTISAGAPIAPGQSAYNLYVLHEQYLNQTYRFAGLSTFTMGAADSLESLNGK